MTDPDQKSVDTASVDPREQSRGTGADTAQSSDERAEAVREFDHHAESDGPDTLDRSEAEVDDGKVLPTPNPGSVSPDDKQTSRTE